MLNTDVRKCIYIYIDILPSGVPIVGLFLGHPSPFDLGPSTSCIYSFKVGSWQFLRPT